MGVNMRTYILYGFSVEWDDNLAEELNENFGKYRALDHLIDGYTKEYIVFGPWLKVSADGRNDIMHLDYSLHMDYRGFKELEKKKNDYVNTFLTLLPEKFHQFLTNRNAQWELKILTHYT